MSSNNLSPIGNNDDFIQVIGVGTSIGGYIVSQLSRYAADLVASGVTGVVIAFERTQIQIRYAKRQEQISYRIAMKEEIYLRFSKAMDRAENNPGLRPELREKLREDLQMDLDDVLSQIRQEFLSNRF
jgi:hypothetical protein